MDQLGLTKPTLKKGTENLTTNGQKLNQTLLDFWRWSNSDLLSNATRGKLAEFIVASALGIGLNEPRDEWDAFDILTQEGIKIEVQSSAYIQSWEQSKKSSISFSIRPAVKWDSESKNREVLAKRHADFYVFCLLKHENQETINPLEMDQWEFYVVPTPDLNERFKDQKTVSLGPLKAIAKAVAYGQIKDQFVRRKGLKEI